MKDRVIAIVLAFFFGGFGIHRFYLRQNGRGVLYLLFCWTGIPSIIGFIDAIIFLFMEPAKFDANYNQQWEEPRYSSSNQSAYRGRANEQNRHSGSVADEIDKLYRLMEQGIITREEFDRRKRAL